MSRHVYAYGRMFGRLRSSAFFLALLAFGCDGAGSGSDAGNASPDAGAERDAGGVEGDAGHGEADAGVCEAVFVASIRGRVEDASGSAVQGARPQVCARLSPGERLSCIAPPESESDGRFGVVVPDDSRCMEHAAMRVFANESFATTYCPFELDAVDGVVQLETAFVLQPATAAIELPEEGDASLPRDVRFDGGLSLSVAPEGLGFGVDYEALAAKRVAAEGLCFVPTDFDEVLAVWAFGQEGSVRDGHDFLLRVDNDFALEPGDMVAFHILGGLETFLADGTYVPEATLAQFATGTVSADGSVIESDGGLPYFSWMVMTRRPR